jgi:hypothetical protein
MSAAMEHHEQLLEFFTAQDYQRMFSLQVGETTAVHRDLEDSSKIHFAYLSPFWLVNVNHSTRTENFCIDQLEIKWLA